MKKTYKRPELYAESFELMEHISSCAVGEGITTVTYRDKFSCSYTDGDVTLFNQTNVNGCLNNFAPFFNEDIDAFLASMKGDDAGCYNAFSNGNVFAS